jgi:hypothetical protein
MGDLIGAALRSRARLNERCVISVSQERPFHRYPPQTDMMVALPFRGLLQMRDKLSPSIDYCGVISVDPADSAGKRGKDHGDAKDIGG